MYTPYTLVQSTGKPILKMQPKNPKTGMTDSPIYDGPNFSPDGKSLLFLAASDGKHGFDYDVFRVNIETGTVEQLTQKSGYTINLRLASNGKMAAMVRQQQDWLTRTKTTGARSIYSIWRAKSSPS
jgi:Tol biopolymer transport system component